MKVYIIIREGTTMSDTYIVGVYADKRKAKKILRERRENVEEKWFSPTYLLYTRTLTE